MASRPSGGNGPAQSDSTVGNYKIGSEIGRGSFATVFKGHHTVSVAWLLCLAHPGCTRLAPEMFVDSYSCQLELLQVLGGYEVVDR